MATGRCRHCGHAPVAFNAPFCPKCVGPNPNEPRSSYLFRIGCVVTILLVTALMMASCGLQGFFQGLFKQAGGDSAITKEDLAGTECVSWAGGMSKFRWSFSEGAFKIESGTDQIPRELLDELVGEGKAAKKIEGAWRLEGGSLILIDVKADNQPTGREGRLSAVRTKAYVLLVSIPGRSNDKYIFDRSIPPAK